MVTLEQVEQLDEKVRKVIALVESLRRENRRLFAENKRLLEEKQGIEYNLREVERRLSTFSGSQEILERGLLGAIDRLDSLSREGEGGVIMSDNFSCHGDGEPDRGGGGSPDVPGSQGSETNMDRGKFPHTDGSFRVVEGREVDIF